MEFLKRFDISDECIDKMKEVYPEEILDNFCFNESNVIKVIMYLKHKMVLDIESILLEHIDLFMKDVNKVIEKFEMNPDYIKKINEEELDWNNLF